MQIYLQKKAARSPLLPFVFSFLLLSLFRPFLFSVPFCSSVFSSIFFFLGSPAGFYPAPYVHSAGFYPALIQLDNGRYNGSSAGFGAHNNGHVCVSIFPALTPSPTLVFPCLTLVSDDLYKFDKLCYLNNLNLRPWDFFQRIEMLVISYNVFGIGSYRTVNKLVIIRIGRK